MAAALVAGAGAAGAAGFEDRFDGPPGPAWHLAHYDFAHPAFATDWRRGLVGWDKALTLGLVPSSGPRFEGASVRREAPTGEGRYVAVLRAARGAGLVTGFFTYTGPHYGTRHDEIDIEILGRDTTAVQVGYFEDGVQVARRVPLGFDAADGFHRYEIVWGAERIDWFVDGRWLWGAEVAGLSPQRLFLNLWAADVAAQDWAGVPRPGTRAEAQVACVGYAPFGAPPPCP